MAFNYHDVTDQRLLALTRACVEKLEPSSNGSPVHRAKVVATITLYPEPHRGEWQRLWALPWPQFKQRLLADTHEGNRIRQNIPFAGVLSQEERQAIFDEYKGKFPPVPRPSAADLAAYPYVDRSPVNYGK